MVGRGSGKTQGHTRVNDNSTPQHSIRSKSTPSRWSIVSLVRAGGISGERLGTTTVLLFLYGVETR
jgi:hypothetical protein